MAQAPNLPLGAEVAGPGSSASASADGTASPSAGLKQHASGFNRIYFSPDILNSLKPPGTSFTLDNMQHRFCAHYEVDAKYCKDLPKEFTGKYFSKSFATSRDWKDCLQKVHAWMWNKYSALPSKAQAKCSVQEPGIIPDAKLMEMEEFVSTMPPPKKYKSNT